MVLPDVNVLVYAYRRESPGHDRYAPWLIGVASGGEELALCEAVLTGFLRIVTNPRIYSDPAPSSHALGFVDALRGSVRISWLSANDAVWAAFAGLVEGDPQVRGNLVADAWLASLAKAHGCRLATADRGFARFPGVDSFDPGRL